VLGQDPRDIDRLTRGLTAYLRFRGAGVETRAASPFNIALWDLFGKLCGQPLYQVLGGASRDRIRAYNTCAGYRYIRSAGGQSTKNWGLDGKSEGPYEDLAAFLHRADELAQSLLESGITGMKRSSSIRCGACRRRSGLRRRSPSSTPSGTRIRSAWTVSPCGSGTRRSPKRRSALPRSSRAAGPSRIC
jgi:hypothetical protein